MQEAVTAYCRLLPAYLSHAAGCLMYSASCRLLSAYSSRWGGGLTMANTNELEEIELRLLLEGVYQRYGYDFREYAPASLKRRVLKCMRDLGLPSISALQAKVLHEAPGIGELLDTMTIDVTGMFRDPGFYRVLRQQVLPSLRASPILRIWHAGCSTGEEVYSLAIALQEEGLYDKAKMYATDMNPRVLAKAREGIFPLAAMKDHTKNYQETGGVRSFSDYYTAKYENALFKPGLKKNIVWAEHNLVTDGSFNEFHIVLCRNVMIYFNATLQARVHELLYDSLAVSGVLGLGSKESLKFTPHEADYQVVSEKEKIFRKIQ